MDKLHKPWSFHELAIGHEPEFAVSIANNTLADSCGAISRVESSIVGMMKEADKHFKANPQFSVDCMREMIEVEINLQKFQAEVGFEMSNGVITDINTLFVIVDGLHWNMNYLIEPLKEGIVEDITDILKGKADES